jgi:ankyrin repeat protein
MPRNIVHLLHHFTFKMRNEKWCKSRAMTDRNKLIELLRDAIDEDDPQTFNEIISSTNDQIVLGEALTSSASLGKIGFAKRLLDGGASINYQNLDVKRTALHEAAFSAKPRTVLFLLKNGASKNIRDRTNRTALQLINYLLEDMSEDNPIYNDLIQCKRYLTTRQILPELTDLSDERHVEIDNNPYYTNTNTETIYTHELDRAPTAINTEEHVFYIVEHTELGKDYLENIKINETDIHVSINDSDEHARKLFNWIKNYELCQNLERQYINRSLHDCDFFIYILSFGLDELLGVCTVMIDTTGKFYIDVICSNLRFAGVGKKMINYIKQIADLNNVTDISLNSVGDAVGFYAKQGFTGNSRTPKYGLTPMVYKLVGGRKFRRTIRRRKNVRRTRKLR